MEGLLKHETYQMMLGAILAIILGVIMLIYPGGTAAMIAGAFWIIKLMVSIFILAYAISETMRCFTADRKGCGLLYLGLGIVATVLVWFFDVGLLYLIVSLFFIMMGIGEIFSAFYLDYGKFFLIFLGLLNIMIGAIMMKYPMLLPLLIAWYVLFWGISRLFLSLELRKMPA